MPRRKGHGIPPTKRVKQPEAISRSAPLKNKLYNEIPAVNVKEEPIQMTVNTVPIKSEPPSIISDALHSKYLHKKFKKMASTLLPEETNNLLNGSRMKSNVRVPEVVNINDSEKAQPPSSASPKAEVPNARVISPPTGRYVCSYCKLACAKPSVLQKHIRAHTNERPYPCLPCGFAFKTKSNLYKHCRSRAHACKVEESGEKMPVICDGEEVVTSEEDDSSNISNAVSVTSRVDTDPESKEELPKSIYKPKYRFMEPIKSPSNNEKNDEKKENANSPPRLHLKIPLPNTTVSVSTPSPFTSGSSPSPEFLQRHISKLISENQAIVETNDPFWTKKYMQRTNSTDNSLSNSLPTSPSPGEMNVKRNNKPTLGLDSLEEISNEKLPQKHSKLALALLRPQSSVSPKYTNLLSSDVCDVQPLNLSTNSKDQKNPQLRIQDQNSRKRSYSEEFSEKSPKSLRDRTSAVPLKINNHSMQDFRKLVQNLSETSDGVILNQADIKKEVIGNPQNPEGSIIKDLLLKARASPSIGQVLNTPGDIKPALSLTPPMSEERAFSPSSQYMCHLCKDPIGYRSAEHLEIHQLYHCKGNEGGSRLTQNSPSPLGDAHRLNSPSYRRTKDGPTMLIAPSHPSPGPLLGSTPLVDSYRTKSPHTPELSPTLLKKRKFDSGSAETRVISATTLRSLEELSKCPMRSNLQMFGGEVKILDTPGGEAKTIRIEPSNRGSGKASEIPLHIISQPGKNVIKDEHDLLDNNIVVTIAKQGLHSGGSIVQVPHKQSSGDQQPSRQVSTSRNVKSLSPAPHLQGYQDPNKVLIPVIPKNVSPNISVAPVQLPFIPFTSILPESTVINPLTNITAYNPLTLPPANMLQPNSPGIGIPSQYSSGIVTILHGGKEIPYVPGMPGPHTLLPNHHVPVYPSPKLDPDQKFIRVSESKSISQEQYSKSSKNDKTQTFINKPSSLNIPTIQVNNETMDSPGDHTSTTNQIRKRSLDESQPASVAPKRSQMSAPEPEEKEKIEDVPEKKFLRPSSLPLKPGTFIPKRQQLGTPVLSLVSPETPRPRKSYGQLYLNGHAYTYLGLKCSTRMFFCTLNKPQPIYVPLSPEHNKVSMYSNWKVCSDADPNPFGLNHPEAMALYDSRHRPTMYTLAKARPSEIVTHSSYWQRTTDRTDKEESAETVPKRVKIFAGGFESNEEYIYIRGRGRGRYVCEECGIRCKKPSMLKKHIRTHTDVRPYTCIHCKFSFKTKGNLTKHMKSKTHYKKCIDLGINPVPTVVDDSYVDEEALARQQALRENQGIDPEESEEEEEEEDDDDDSEDDNEEYEEEGEAEGEECIEREAARSLLTLSESLQSVAQRKQANAGLLPVSGRPFTYPYSFSQVTETSVVTEPQTPTLTAISAHREREKVSQNTGLAREVQIKGSLEEPKGNVGEKGVAARYYFPSSRDLGDSSRESGVLKQPTPMDLSSKPTDKSTRVNEAAMLLASLCSTMERLPLTTTTATVSEDSTLLQAYLTERAVQDSRMKQHQYKHKPISLEVSTSSLDQRVKTNISAAKENALGILAQTSSDARKQPTDPVTTSTFSLPSKPQAEFLPPSSGPSPSYVSILEDGRSMCNICNKIFSKPSQLRLHVNIHYFERPFRCESCAVSFRTKGHLQKHQRSVSHLNKVSMNSTFGTATTTNPRPFKCDDCKIAFRIHGHLAKHLRSKMHIMKLECLGKLPFGTYAEMERSGVNMNDIDTTDCENSLESLQLLAQKLYEKDPSKLGQWDPNEMMPQHTMSSGDTSSEGEEDPQPPPLMASPPVQRIAPPPLQRVSMTSVQEPLKCVINIRNSSINFNLKGPKHKVSEVPEESGTEAVESVSETRTDEQGQP